MQTSVSQCLLISNLLSFIMRIWKGYGSASCGQQYKYRINTREGFEADFSSNLIFRRYFFLSTSKRRVRNEIHLLLSVLNTCWSGIMKNILIQGWVIIVIPFLTFLMDEFESRLYLYYLMVLTHPRVYIWSSSPAVLILFREMISCTKFWKKLCEST